MDKNYRVQLEIAGYYAMFTRPDTGSAFVSYPAPTWSACKGILESVARIKTAYIHPTKAEICSPIKFHRYMTNYGGPLRKPDQKKKGASYQLGAYVLVDVCYRIYGTVKELMPSPNKGINHLHYLQDLFLRRLETGRLYETPCLGWREFVPYYFGPFKKETKVEESINEFIPSMLFSPFDKNTEGNSLTENGSNAARYCRDVWIKKGELNYVE